MMPSLPLSSCEAVNNKKNISNKKFTFSTIRSVQFGGHFFIRRSKVYFLRYIYIVLSYIILNSIEKWIKSYRYITVNNARQTSMQDNNTDCLRAMYLQSRQDIWQLDKAKKPRDSDDEISKLIDSFFLKSEDSKVWSFETERLNP